MNTDTPETKSTMPERDALWAKHDGLTPRCCADMIALAGKLEIERNQAKKERDELANAIRSFYTDYEAIQWGYDGDGGSARLADILFESLEKLKENKSGGVS